MTWISGLSATSDIEVRRVEGVHGLWNLEVIAVEGMDIGPGKEYTSRPQRTRG